MALDKVSPGRVTKKKKPKKGLSLMKRGKVEDITSQIPGELKALDIWGLCKLIKLPDKAKPVKLPVQLSGEVASSINRDHFSPLEEVMKSKMWDNPDIKGLAMGIFAEHDITLLDFDEVDAMPAKARKAIMQLSKLSYSEHSQSGNGIHVFFKGKISEIKRSVFKWGKVPLEHYTDKRFVFVTGNVTEWSGQLSEIDTDSIVDILGPIPEEATRPRLSLVENSEVLSQEPTIETEEVLQSLRDKATDNPRHGSGAHAALVYLLEGYDEAMDLEAFGFSDDSGNKRSECDLACCKELVRVGAVFSQVNELMQEHNPRGDGKWDRGDYRAGTFLRAHEEVSKERKLVAATLDDFEDFEGTHEERKEKVRLATHKLDKKDRTLLFDTVRLYNAALNSGAPQKRINKLYGKCKKIADRINLREVLRLNESYGTVYVGGDLFVGGFKQGLKRLMRWEAFRRGSLNENNAVHLKEAAAGAGNDHGRLKIVPVLSVEEWVAHEECRRFVGNPEFLPSPDLLMSHDNFNDLPRHVPFNLFPGCLYKPEKETAKFNLILEHLLDVWCSDDPEIYNYILDWFARMVQYPHKQGMTSIVLKSDPGAGKNIITDIFTGYYGAHSVEIQDMDSLGGFNARAGEAILLVLNEATFGGSKRTQGVLKNFITGNKVNIEKKYQDSIEVNNCTHICIFSNNDWIVPVDMFDRRLLIMECSEVKSREYFLRLSDQIKRGGDRAFIEFLLKRDVSCFNPVVIPKHGESAEHIEQSRRSLYEFEQWCLEIIEDGAVTMRSGVEIELDKKEPTKISIKDLKDAYYGSEHYKQSRSKSNGCRDMPHRMSRLYGVAVKELRAVPCRTTQKRGRGVKIPPLRAIKRNWKWGSFPC